MFSIINNITNLTADTFSQMKQYCLQAALNLKPHFKRHHNLIITVTSVVVVTLTMLVICYVHHSNQQLLATTNHHHEQIVKNEVTTALDDIAHKLVSLEKSLSSKNTVVNLDPLRAELAKLIEQTNTLAQQSNQLITQQIKSSTTELETRLVRISTALQQLQAEHKQVSYLGASNLVFQVLHIDIIQQQAVVTVRYNHTSFPLEAGDTLAGWQLTHADFAKQQAEFMNNKRQQVRVDLNHVIVAGA